MKGRQVYVPVSHAYCAVLWLVLLLLHTEEGISIMYGKNTHKMRPNLPKMPLKTYDILDTVCSLFTASSCALLLHLCLLIEVESTLHYHCLMSTVPTFTTLPSCTKPDRAPMIHPSMPWPTPKPALVLCHTANLQYKYKYPLSACHLVGT